MTFDYDLNLGRVNLNFRCDTSSLLYFSMKFDYITFTGFLVMTNAQFVTYGQTDDRTGGRTVDAILICHPKFLGEGH